MFNITHAMSIINNPLPPEEILRISKILELIYEHEWSQLVKALLENRLEKEERWIKIDQLFTMAAGTARATILNELQSLKEEGYIEIRKEHSASFCRFVAQTIYLISVHPKSIRGFYQAILNAFRYKDFEECRINHDSLRQVAIYNCVAQTKNQYAWQEKREEILKEKQMDAELSTYI